MKKIIFILFVIIATTFFSIQFEIKLPIFDKNNGVYQIYTFEHQNKLEVTVVFWDEDYPNSLIDFIYDIYRFFKWGRFYDIETFFILDDKVIFEDDYCNSQSYFQTEKLHNYKELSTNTFEKDGEKLVIYVSTWNHMFLNKPLPNTNYITYFSTNLVGTRSDVEQFFSWHKNKKLITTFSFSLIVVIFAILTIFIKKMPKSKVIFKVLTTFTIFLIALLNSSGAEFLIVTGLFFGMIGDFLLEFEDKFLHGMFSFLIGHIFYSLSFLIKFGIPNILVFFIILPILLILYFVILFKKAENFKLPILVYTVAIGIMFSFTFAPAFKDIYYLRCMLPLAGGLFVFSDFLIAIEKFVRKIKYSEIIILGTYFLAQLIIALSTIF